jgi:hypothetical protein
MISMEWASLDKLTIFALFSVFLASGSAGSPNDRHGFRMKQDARMDRMRADFLTERMDMNKSPWNGFEKDDHNLIFYGTIGRKSRGGLKEWHETSP